MRHGGWAGVPEGGTLTAVVGEQEAVTHGGSPRDGREGDGMCLLCVHISVCAHTHVYPCGHVYMCISTECVSSFVHTWWEHSHVCTCIWGNRHWEGYGGMPKPDTPVQVWGLSGLPLPRGDRTPLGNPPGTPTFELPGTSEVLPSPSGAEPR